MAGPTNSAVHDMIPMRELKWSPGEKAAARKAFDGALRRELDSAMREAKARAAKIETPSELWELEEWLTRRRLDIDRKYDYRYSVLPLVFAVLLREGRLKEDDLAGLGQNKLERIRRGAAF
jgi:Photoprotection regulator fluorescence recovery protein